MQQPVTTYYLFQGALMKRSLNNWFPQRINAIIGASKNILSDNQDKLYRYTQRIKSLAAFVLCVQVSQYNTHPSQLLYSYVQLSCVDK